MEKHYSDSLNLTSFQIGYFNKEIYQLPTNNVYYNGTSISKCYNYWILEQVVMEIVVGGKSHDTTPGNRQGIEGLSCSVFPDLKHKVIYILNVTYNSRFRQQ